MIGPPLSVAIARDESFALVTGATKIDPADPKKTVPDDKLTVDRSQGLAAQSLGAVAGGQGRRGVSINRAGTLALVANRSEGHGLRLFIAGNTLTPVGKISLGDDKSGPSHVAITPDGKTALVTRDGDNKISVLSIDGTKVEHTKRDISAGLRPYGLVIHPDGKLAVVGEYRDGERRRRYRERHRYRGESRRASFIPSPSVKRRKGLRCLPTVPFSPWA